MVPARAYQVTPDGGSMTPAIPIRGSRIKDVLAKEDFNISSIYHPEMPENARRWVRTRAEGQIGG